MLEDEANKLADKLNSLTLSEFKYMQQVLEQKHGILVEMNISFKKPYFVDKSAEKTKHYDLDAVDPHCNCRPDDEWSFESCPAHTYKDYRRWDYKDGRSPSYERDRADY